MPAAQWERLMQGQQISVFDGVPEEELRTVLARLEHRRFPAGSTVLAQGDAPRHLYVIVSGAADVFYTDRRGGELRVGQVGPEETLGEMGLLTGQSVSATVRATADLDVLLVSEAEFRRLAAAFPQIYRNVSAILSERLARSNQRSPRRDAVQVAALLDDGAPPLLGYAVACSLAWHARKPTLLVIVDPGKPPEALTRLAAARPPVSVPEHRGAVSPASHDGTRGGFDPRPVSGFRSGADLLITPPAGAFAPDALTRTLDQLCGQYDHVLVQFPGTGGRLPPAATARIVQLMGPHDTPPLPDTCTRGAAEAAGGPDRQARANAPDLVIRAWSDRRGPRRPGKDGVLHVPALVPDEEQAVREGMLPAAGRAGRALGWAARMLAGLQVGLALGAGSVRGYAHLGVLEVLQRAGVTIDYLAGTSIGATVAALWSTGHDPHAAARVLDEVGLGAFRPTVPTRSLLSSAGLRAAAKRLAGNARIEDLPIPLAVVAADLVTRQEVIFRRGLLWPALLASVSIPGIYPPQRMGRYLLVDGGILNPVPSNVAADMGADTVIAVKLAGRPIPPGTQAEAAEAAGRSPSVLQAIMRSIETMQGKIVTDTAAAATVVIEPVFAEAAGWGLRNFSAGRRYIPLGAAAAEAALPRIAATLPWVSSGG